MPTATFVFLNCHQLDYLANKQLPTQKILGLADMLRAAAGKKPPSVFGLCEVYDIDLAKELAEQVAANTYEVIMSTAPSDTMGAMGLALCFDTKILSMVDVVRDRPRRPRVNSRSFWLAAQLQFQNGSKASWWIILNHWKSWIDGELETEFKRIENYREMEELFRTTSDLRGQSTVSAPVKPVIDADAFVLIAGDFNCEPGSRPLCFPMGAAVEVRRHPGSVAGTASSRVLFLNTMWPAVGRADQGLPGYFQGTYANSRSTYGPRLFDQILVSKALLDSGALIRYIAGSTKIQAPKGLASSDHSAVAAKVAY
jgi:hypothetical protein